MIKELHYPIKYAVLELKVDGGYAVNYKDITQGFIASKCYVVGNETKYYEDGTSKIIYKVVFPYQDIHTFQNQRRINVFEENDIGKRIIPGYDYYNNPYPVNIVDDIYDTYEEAKDASKQKNHIHRIKLYNNVSFSDPEYQKKVDELMDEFEKSLQDCYAYEKLVLNETEDMNISTEDIKVRTLKK